MEPDPGDTEVLKRSLSSVLERTLVPLRDSADPLGVLFSGGVDSSLLAWELRLRPNLLLCTLGREGSPDLRAGKAGAELLGLPWVEMRFGSEEVREAAVRFGTELTGLPRVARTVLLSLALAIDRAPPARLVCGQGLDELFLGYAHYRGLDPVEADQRSREDLARLRGAEWPRTQRIAEVAQKQVVAPFLSPEFEACVRHVPIDLRLPRDLPKRFLREWAMDRGLPSELALRPKKAVQYGSGVASLARTLEREDR